MVQSPQQGKHTGPGINDGSMCGSAYITPTDAFGKLFIQPLQLWARQRLCFLKRARNSERAPGLEQHHRHIELLMPRDQQAKRGDGFL